MGVTSKVLKIVYGMRQLRQQQKLQPKLPSAYDRRYFDAFNMKWTMHLIVFLLSQLNKKTTIFHEIIKTNSSVYRNRSKESELSKSGPIPSVIFIKGQITSNPNARIRHNLQDKIYHWSNKKHCWRRGDDVHVFVLITIGTIGEYEFSNSLLQHRRRQLYTLQMNSNE